MSLMKFLSGPTPDKLEAKGDALQEAGLWGQARQVYERALAKLEKAALRDTDQFRRLQDKRDQSREALAREHQRTALDYLDGGFSREACETLRLALDISGDEGFRAEVARQLAAMEEASEPEWDPSWRSAQSSASRKDNADPEVQAPSPEDHFQALCHTLPEDVARAYRHYGPDFVDGYIALNNGHFELAARHLERAMATHPQPDSYIPLELATAYMNQGRLEAARDLLEQVRRHHPEALPVYQLLCEIYWEQEAIALAEALLASLPAHLAQTGAGLHLKGETLYRAGRFREARDFYRSALDRYGWNDRLAQELAKVCETLDELDGARQLYREILIRCQSCRTRVAPEISHKYAELSFAAGLRDTDLLERYLALARDNPSQAALYFDRISRIYRDQGNGIEEKRFRGFARRAALENKTPDEE